MTKAPEINDLTKIDHIAIQVRDGKLAETVDFYLQKFACQVEYQDDTWALLAFQNIKLAFVIPAQHPPHIAIVSPEAESFGALKTHRDGTRSVYVDDPSSNKLEIIAPY